MLMSYPSLEDIFDFLAFEPGETVYVASDVGLFSIEYGRYHDDFTPSRVIELLQQRLTPDGTIIIPTFSWDFCHGLGFDYYKTQPRVGYLGKVALRTEGFKRTKHPIYSYAVWGKGKDLYTSLDNKDSWGEGSPFDLMYRDNAAWFAFCVYCSGSFTFTHYVEQALQVPYRYMKDFTGKYVDELGQASARTYSMFVHSLDVPRRRVIPREREEWFAENVSEASVECYGAPIRKLHCRPAFELIKTYLLETVVTNREKYVGTLAE